MSNRPQAAPHSVPPDSPRSSTAIDAGHSWSAGSGSLILHAVGFLILALFVRSPGNAVQPTSEPERPVELVLVQPGAVDREREREREKYLDRTEIQPAEVSLAESTASQSGISAGELSQVLADLPPETRLPETRLPDAQSDGSVALPSTFDLLDSGARRAKAIPLSRDVGAIVAAEQARLKAGRPVGEPTSLGIFGGAAAEGRSFFFLIDRSKSMGSEGLGALEAAEHELVRALAGLRPHHRFQVAAYHHACVYLHGRDLLPATVENQARVSGFLSGLAAFGATEHDLALQSALSHGPDVIFLLTDGGDPELTDPQIRRLARLARGKTAIHCVQFGIGEPPDENHFLRRLAAANQGHYQFVDRTRTK